MYQCSKYPTICIPIRYENSNGRYVSGSVSQMVMYRGRIPCITDVSRFNLVSYDTCEIRVSLAEPGLGCATLQKIHFFCFLHGSVLGLGRVCVTHQILLGEPLCIPGFCFVTFQFNWNYSEKPHMFLYFTTSHTKKLE